MPHQLDVSTAQDASGLALRYFRRETQIAISTSRSNHLQPWQTGPLDGHVMRSAPVHQDFNCLAWSLGHTDRWIEANYVTDMESLYQAHNFIECGPHEADIDVYWAIETPEWRRRGKTLRTYDQRARIVHARRRDVGDRPGLMWPLKRHSKETIAYSPWATPPPVSFEAAGVNSMVCKPKRRYAKVPALGLYEPIPEPSQVAQDWTAGMYEAIRKVVPEMVHKFERRFVAWQRTWAFCDSESAEDRCYVNEFNKLFDMGPAILPLVVFWLLESRNFTAVFLYNALEPNKKFRIDPKDILNFCVLQRQSSLLVEINCGRKW